MSPLPNEVNLNAHSLDRSANEGVKISVIYLMEHIDRSSRKGMRNSLFLNFWSSVLSQLN